MKKVRLLIMDPELEYFKFQDIEGMGFIHPFLKDFFVKIIIQNSATLDSLTFFDDVRAHTISFKKFENIFSKKNTLKEVYECIS